MFVISKMSSWGDINLHISLQKRPFTLEIMTGERDPAGGQGVNIPATGTLTPDDARLLATGLRLAADIAEGKVKLAKDGEL